MTKIQNGQRGTGKVTPETLAMMVELLPTIGSLRDLCAVTGLRLDAVRREVAPFLAIMKLTGTHPKCGCGKDRFHPYGCTDSVAKSERNGLLPGLNKVQSMIALERRASVIEQLIAGDRLVDIDRMHGFSKGGGKWFLRYLTDEQMTERQDNMRRRGNIRQASQEKPRPLPGRVVGRIAPATRHSFAPMRIAA